MAQASLTPGPGTFVEDALAPELADGSTVSADTTNDWVSVDRPWDCVVVLETATVTGTGTAVVRIQAADDDSGTNTVTLGVFELAADDDDAELIQVVSTHKPYMRADFDVTGTIGIPATITVRDKTYHQADDRTA